MGSLRLYNTLTGKKEEFSPLSGGRVGMYVCGITPYDYAHLGHARCYVVFDVLRRYLGYTGYKVNYIQNITDIDDKIIKKSKETGKSPRHIAEKYFADFQESMELLNVRPATLYPRVSENIDEIISFIRGLIENGNAYESAGSVYFQTDSYSGYGELSGRDPEDMQAAASGYGSQKKNPADFALWKKDKEFGWESPWGRGRPGWHIECSAISKKFLGEEFDIHGGGLDLVFPHHENEVAQSKALTGKDPVKFWVHNGMVNLKGDKMAKSTGNFFLLRELLASYDPMIVRMYLLTTGYRQVLNFDPAELADTAKAFNKLCEFKKELLQAAPDMALPSVAPDKVAGALNNDLNTSAAIGEIFKIANPMTEKIFNESLNKEDIQKGLEAVAAMENILGVDLTLKEGPDEARVEKLLEERRRLREEKKYSRADRIRDELLKEGIRIKDTPSGTKWFRK
jgi:cysteinyl-tRNA synthetase